MFWYKGQQINSPHLQLDINDPGLCFGATVFSTMRVYEKSIAHPMTSWQAHCDRLKTSIQAFAWQEPSWQDLATGAKLLAQHHTVLRLTIFPDGRELIVGRELPANLPQRQQSGIVGWVARYPQYQRQLPQYKTGNYLTTYLARSQALSHQAQEAILVDAQGNWLETSTGNLWGWQYGCWYTPPLDSGILPGIARSRWFHFWQSKGYKVKEITWTPDFVRGLESIAYSNCVVDFVPFKTVIDNQQIWNFPPRQPEN
ncbi:MAG: aminotransferase class IV [Cyanobacteria bacterium J06621_8]